jgi:hypothetical protein
VLGDLEQPRALRRRLDALFQAPVRVQEHDLRGVLRLFAGPQTAQAVVEDRLRVPVVQDLRPQAGRGNEAPQDGYRATSSPFVASSCRSSGRERTPSLAWTELM